MARSMSSVPWAWSPISSLMARFQPAIMLPRAAVGERAALIGAMRQRRDRARKAAIAVTSLNVEPGGYWP